MAQQLMNPSRIHEDVGSIPGLTQCLRSSVAMTCGVGHRRGSDLVLLWLWYRPAAAAPIRLLAWKPPYAAGAALKRKKKDRLQAIPLVNAPAFPHKLPQCGYLGIRVGVLRRFNSHGTLNLQSPMTHYIPVEAECIEAVVVKGMEYLWIY